MNKFPAIVVIIGSVMFLTAAFMPICNELLREVFGHGLLLHSAR
jgi:hypothetical protein